jgi:hypothetical protein
MMGMACYVKYYRSFVPLPTQTKKQFSSCQKIHHYKELEFGLKRLKQELGVSGATPYYLAEKRPLNHTHRMHHYHKWMAYSG